ncbi:MAG: DNA-directed RNA polymerase subunit omega [Deltaproteobacteria bacterium]|nr:DNA-directed RNA polymerase subunit omega [Deltaproteobacteria bacterium]
MARITVEDCLERVDNRFGLIHLAANRVRQLRKGAKPLVVCKNRDTVVALREIAAGKVFQQDPVAKKALAEDTTDLLLETLSEKPKPEDLKTEVDGAEAAPVESES